MARAKYSKSAAEFIKERKVKLLMSGPIGMKDIGRRGRVFFKVEACTLLPQHNFPHKVFVLERLRKVTFSGKLEHRKFWKKHDIEYRIGYYIVGSIGKKKGVWTWGQFAPLIPAKDLSKLISKAKREKVLQ